MGIEILNQVPKTDVIIVPVCGGGLITGIALAVKTLNPSIQVIFHGSACHRVSRGHQHQTDPCRWFGGPKVGENAFEVPAPLIDIMVTVSEKPIALSVLRLCELVKFVEGGGATSLAAIIDKLPDLRGKRIVMPLCGGNSETSVLGGGSLVPSHRRRHGGASFLRKMVNELTESVEFA
ncbi:hypothetical protein H310_07851 [Aphanomyces invadans]|uniref:Tryptophan synthase beta chain-like PALP domain-containing protein n=1 Tax=Aphanomyces invadans TaxID=157072 RepID=A0A024U0R1_9STRA|nr:hypothetical protein H310_07851 [Aphanomyces invadans]ETV99809.1 hypothetical protein H310_07851 [Aphanomyces invadans]|eukprot:XP_008871585.1 hypothetical protein H310_07851 [Aphanomyces invadans]